MSMEMERRETRATERSSAFERRPCPICGLILSILRLGTPFQAITCPHCDSELLLSGDKIDRRGLPVS